MVQNGFQPAERCGLTKRRGLTERPGLTERCGLTTRDSLGAESLPWLAREIADCRICREQPIAGSTLPHEPRPIFRLSHTARLLIASQAPGLRAHDSGVPFNDPSGDRLRAWMGLDRETFYDQSRIAIAPMGFCFPGYDALGGDLPPRRECRAQWHDRLFALMPQIETVLAIGGYAHAYHFARLGRPYARSDKVDATVRRWKEFEAGVPRLFPLPHPSWRNSGWLKRNPWFEADLLPDLRAEVARAVAPAQAFSAA